ncbi:hypothetical protein [Puia dinghuensis]|uniref:Lipoprotein n=1 Tax=Puia dinghuensis TaxID=1792502 RepID=A0A8J2XNZ2_9BACT|nr:hypothetical protein [Puia dinghuensis]GGA85890.1 hypothetical protein GCM10011511_06180 [Puia dinghuensis]
MKTKNIQHLLVATSLSLLLFACSKNNSNSSSTPSNSDLQTQSTDQTEITAETDAAFNDVNTAMTSQATVSGASEGSSLRYGVTVDGGNQDTVKSYICDAVVTIDTVDNPRTITINYNGANCSLTRTRTGKVVISFAKGVTWRTQGAVVTVTFDSLKITRLSNGKTLTLNGTHTYTNVTGGSLASLSASNAGPIIHTVTSNNMSITFDNGAQRSWNIARQRSFTYSSGLVMTETGMQTQNGVSGISEWGTNRFGNAFTMQIVNGLVISQSCFFQLTTGQVALTNVAGTTDITFGLDANGNSTGCPVSPATYYFKLVWTGNGGKTYTTIQAY